MNGTYIDFAHERRSQVEPHRHEIALNIIDVGLAVDLLANLRHRGVPGAVKIVAHEAEEVGVIQEPGGIIVLRTQSAQA